MEMKKNTTHSFIALQQGEQHCTLHFRDRFSYVYVHHKLTLRTCARETIDIHRILHTSLQNITYILLTILRTSCCQ